MMTQQKVLRFSNFVPALLLSFVYLCFSISFAETVHYDYPYKNSLISTLTGAVAHASRPLEVVQLEYRPDRRDVPFLKGRNKISVRLFRQSQAAPLMFVIPGLGGYSGSGAATMLAETFFDAGYNVVTLPNNVSWQYTLGVSQSAVPGYMPRDAGEYYQFMQFVVENLKATKNLQPTSYAISGFSLGGLLTAFLVEQDVQQHVFDFKKIILINPAVDIEFGIGALDKLQAAGNGLTPAQKQKDIGLAFNLGADLLGAPMNLATFQGAVPKLSTLSDDEIRWLIGQSFRQSVRDVIVTGQRVHDTGFLKTKEFKNRADALLGEASQYSFSEYMNLLVYPTLKVGTLSREQAMAKSSLYALTPLLRSNPNIFVFENADDLIIKPSDIKYFEKTLGSRFKLYPHGGHLGNLWWEQNKKDLIRAATPVK